MYTLVTGGTGFLGQHLVHQLLTRHENIRLLSRHYDPTLNHPNIQQVVGSILDHSSLHKALDQVTHVYHLAGRVDRDPKDASQMYQLHVDGTVALLDAIRKINDSQNQPHIQKIVVASTSGTVAVSKSPDFIADDFAPYADQTVANWPYYLSKIYQERVLDRYLSHFKLPIITLRPTLLLGPGDHRQSSTEDVAAFLNNEIKVVPKGGLSFVDVRDAADAFILAMDLANPGDKFLLGAANLSLHGFFQILASMTDKSPPLEVDQRLVKTGASILRNLRKALNQRPSQAFDSVSIDMAQHYWYLDSSRAKQQLGWKPRSIELTLRDTIDWLNENHPQLAPKSPQRKAPPQQFVPQQTLDYANKIRKAPATDPHEFDNIS